MELLPLVPHLDDVIKLFRGPGEFLLHVNKFSLASGKLIFDMWVPQLLCFELPSLFFIVQPIGKKFDSPEVNYNQFSVLFLKTVTYLWSGLKDFIGDVLILFLYNTVSPVQGKTGMDI